MNNLYIIKNSTFKGTWIRYRDNKHYKIYQEHYIALNKTSKKPVNQMNSMSYKRETLLIFKDLKEATKFCKLINSQLPKGDLYNHDEHKIVKYNDYKVVKYTSKKPINNLKEVTTAFGKAYIIE